MQPHFDTPPTMNTTRAIHGVVLALSLAAGSALAHGDEDHAKKPAFNAATAEETSFGREGDPKRAHRVVKLAMSDAMRFTPADIRVKRGETVKFVVHNGGRMLHEMVLGTPDELKAHAELMRRFPDMEHADAHMTHVKPGADGVIVWQFTQPGEFQFACLIPGHFEAGMVGKVTVK
jgi:uncharacterized cupredoxin-like copper-binding protein